MNILIVICFSCSSCVVYSVHFMDLKRKFIKDACPLQTLVFWGTVTPTEAFLNHLTSFRPTSAVDLLMNLRYKLDRVALLILINIIPLELGGTVRSG